MPTPPSSVAAYLASLPEDLRREVSAVRDAVNRGLPAGYEEGIQYGMIGWYVPHAIFPQGYHCNPKQPLPFAALAGRKHGVSVGFMGMYGDDARWARFQRAWAATGEKLDKGVCCVRFRHATPATLALLRDTVADLPVEAYVGRYVETLRRLGKWSAGDAASKPTARSKAAAKRTPARKPADRTKPAHRTEAADRRKAAGTSKPRGRSSR